MQDACTLLVPAARRQAQALSGFLIVAARLLGMSAQQLHNSMHNGHCRATLSPAEPEEFRLGI